jgi:hypothetical protein
MLATLPTKNYCRRSSPGPGICGVHHLGKPTADS